MSLQLGMFERCGNLFEAIAEFIFASENMPIDRLSLYEAE